MGEVAVLHPQDILKNQFNRKHRNNLIQPPMKSRKYPKNLDAYNPNPNPTPAKVRRRKRSPANSRNSSRAPSDDESKSLVMGKVKILKRGEDLTTSLDDSLLIKKEDNAETAAAIVSEDLVVPTSKTVSKQLDIYAGYGFYLSPPPSSLPLPAFFKKKSLVDSNNNNFTGDFRRLLRLDLD